MTGKDWLAAYLILAAMPRSHLVPHHLRGRLWTPMEWGELQSDMSYIQETLAWARDFLCRPHENLGRKGPVCPFMPDAVNWDTLWTAVLWPQPLSADSIEQAVAGYRQAFLDTPPHDGVESDHKAFILIFPEVPLDRASELIDAVQHRLKADFVRSGLMLGEFHLRNETPGLHSPEFKPLKTPYPSLAIRHMVESDVVFMHLSTNSPEERIAYLEAWLERLQGRAKQRRVDEALEALAQARKEIV